MSIKPAGAGFGLVAWVLPVALLMVGAVGITAMISHWRVTSTVESIGEVATTLRDASGQTANRTVVTDEERHRAVVERELHSLDG